MNRAEKIRNIPNMTDEELAQFLCSITTDCHHCKAIKYCSVGHVGYLEWLKEEE